MARFVFTAHDPETAETLDYKESTPREDKIERENYGSGYLAFWLRCKADWIGKDYRGVISDLDTGEEWEI